MAVMQTLTTPGACETEEKQGLSFTTGGNTEQCSHLGDSVTISYKIKYTLSIQSSSGAP